MWGGATRKWMQSCRGSARGGEQGRGGRCGKLREKAEKRGYDDFLGWFSRAPLGSNATGFWWGHDKNHFSIYTIS